MERDRTEGDLDPLERLERAFVRASPASAGPQDLDARLAETSDDTPSAPRRPRRRIDVDDDDDMLPATRADLRALQDTLDRVCQRLDELSADLQELRRSGLSGVMGPASPPEGLEEVARRLEALESDRDGRTFRLRRRSP